MITPDDDGLDLLTRQLASDDDDCVVIGGGLRVPPKRLLLFERVVNEIRTSLQGVKIALNTRPEETADAAAPWLT